MPFEEFQVKESHKNHILDRWKWVLHGKVEGGKEVTPARPVDELSSERGG